MNDLVSTLTLRDADNVAVAVIVSNGQTTKVLKAIPEFRREITKRVRDGLSFRAESSYASLNVLPNNGKTLLNKLAIFYQTVNLFRAVISDYLPSRGPCGICGNCLLDGRHRLLDTIISRVKGRDSIETVAHDYSLPEEVVQFIIFYN